MSRPSTAFLRLAERASLRLQYLALLDAEAHTRAWARPTDQDLEREHRARLQRIGRLLEDGRVDAARHEALTSP